MDGESEVTLSQQHDVKLRNVLRFIDINTSFVKIVFNFSLNIHGRFLTIIKTKAIILCRFKI